MPSLPRRTAEHARLAESAAAPVPPWRRWGCYVSERAWGTVREDYSADGDPWNFLPQYFHGDNGAGLGANHQTGWTGLAANLIDEWRR